jgi:hypothetical protein
MNNGDVLITYSDEKYIIYNIDRDFIYVTDFDTQTLMQILLVQEIKEWHEKPSNVEFMFLNRRETDLEDIKEYL